MKFTNAAMIVCLTAGAVCAQDKPAAAPPAPATAQNQEYDAAIIPVKTLSGDSFDRLVRLLAVFPAQVRADDKLRSIVVYAPKDVVEKMRQVVAALDKPGSEAAIGRNIEMTLTFLRCSTKAGAQPSTLPADIEPVAKQLRTATQCKDIDALDSVPLHLQEGKNTQETLRLPMPGVGNLSATGTIRIHPEGVSIRGQGRYVRFSDLTFNFRMPSPPSSQYLDVGFTTSGDFMEGQKTVLGKLSGTDDETAIFVVISLKVLD